jgi:acyl-CoA thioesterase I
MCNTAPDRRTLVTAALAALATPALAASPPYRITMLGDSITAGYGLRAGQAVPARLEAELVRLGVAARVTAAGVSGDTSAAGLQRVDFSVRPGTQLCIVAFGGNDLLQGLEPRLLERNLTGIRARLKTRKIAALLAGIQAPSVLGADYARDFNGAFARVARTQGVPLHPDLLAGLAGRADLMQRDGIHPNPAGADLIAKRLAPLVVRSLRALR